MTCNHMLVNAVALFGGKIVRFSSKPVAVKRDLTGHGVMAPPFRGLAFGVRQRSVAKHRIPNDLKEIRRQHFQIDP